MNVDASTGGGIEGEAKRKRKVRREVKIKEQSPRPQSVL